MSAGAVNTARIRELNDVFRTTFIGGRLYITAGIYDLGLDFKCRCIAAVQGFRDFTGDNDSHGEHDFGAMTIDGSRVFWKIDYYDYDCQHGSENPADPAVTTRVLTIMLASEY
ncbi:MULTISPECIES: DUF3768 domain-containing protein [unclassified Sphingomonas]|uniref:DUF3768 domain-containing protein n=1 Tax=unclassified Sphingomonas TaxID=196159 RepID=UPI000700A828|nr:MULTISPECIES: DUF3768 domain-containing protein [unclassified Sphingomonas]KQX22773.1 hypothetical protein ASD17_05695 [Sphingomonas sp. Root1294]KQY67749.1 hypothetical protein ASD39_07430 [Sphingomonas sp. Root50]